MTFARFSTRAMHMLVSSLVLTMTLTSPGCHGHKARASARATLLTNGAWRYEEYIVNGRAIATPNDRLQFMPDGTSLLDDGRNRTNGSRWALTNDETAILFNGGTEEETTVDIVELSEVRLRISGRTAGPDGQPVPFEASFQH